MSQVALLNLGLVAEPTAQVADVRVDVPAPTAQIAELGVTAVGDVVLLAQGATVEGNEVESHDTVTLRAIAPSGGAVTFERVDTDPATVTLAGAGLTRTFVTPCRLNGAALQFRARVDLGGGTFSAWSTVDVLVRPHQVWYRSAGTLTAVRLERKGGTP